MDVVQPVQVNRPSTACAVRFKGPAYLLFQLKPSGLATEKSAMQQVDFKVNRLWGDQLQSHNYWQQPKLDCLYMIACSLRQTAVVCQITPVTYLTTAYSSPVP
jgi:hypothetical protein